MLGCLRIILMSDFVQKCRPSQTIRLIAGNQQLHFLIHILLPFCDFFLLFVQFDLSFIQKNPKCIKITLLHSALCSLSSNLFSEPSYLIGFSSHWWVFSLSPMWLWCCRHNLIRIGLQFVAIRYYILLGNVWQWDIWIIAKFTSLIPSRSIYRPTLHILSPLLGEVCLETCTSCIYCCGNEVMLIWI